MTGTTADVKARAARIWERVHDSAPPGEWPRITHLVEGEPLAAVPDGFSAFAVGPWPDDPGAGPAGRSVVVLPTLDPAAPYGVQRRYLARVVADGSGRCPMCSAVAGIVGPDPERARYAFHRLPLTVGIRHSTGCPAEFTDDERQWFPVHRGGGAA